MTETSESTLSLLSDREFLALSGTAFARAQAYSTILIALALYADQFGTTGLVEGLFGTAFAAVQLLIVLPLGRAIDTGNAKKFILAGLAVNVAVFFGFILVSNPVHVILVRMVQGIGASILWITGSTVVGEISPDGSRGRWLGSYNQVAALSSFAGDLVGGYLLHTYDFTFTYVVLAGFTLAAFVLVFFFLRQNPGGRKDPEEATGLETIRDLLGLPMIRSLVAFRLGFSVGKMAVIIFLPIYAKVAFDINSLFIGFILAGGKLSKAVFQGYVGELTDRLGHAHYFVAVGALLYALGTALIPLASLESVRGFALALDASAARGAVDALPAVAGGLLPRVAFGSYATSTVIGGPFLVLFLAYGVLGIADSIRLPASMSMFVEEGEKYDSVASAFSLRSISWKIGQILGPLGVGVIKDVYGIFAAFWTAAAALVVATGVFLLMYVRGQRVESPQAVTGD